MATFPSRDESLLDDRMSDATMTTDTVGQESYWEDLTFHELHQTSKEEDKFGFSHLEQRRGYDSGFGTACSTRRQSPEPSIDKVQILSPTICRLSHQDEGDVSSRVDDQSSAMSDSQLEKIKPATESAPNSTKSECSISSSHSLAHDSGDFSSSIAHIANLEKDEVQTIIVASEGDTQVQASGKPSSGTFGEEKQVNVEQNIAGTFQLDVPERASSQSTLGEPAASDSTFTAEPEDVPQNILVNSSLSSLPYSDNEYLPLSPVGCTSRTSISIVIHQRSRPRSLRRTISTNSYYIVHSIPRLYYKSSSPSLISRLLRILTSPFHRLRARKRSVRESVAMQDEMKRLHSQMREEELRVKQGGGGQLPSYTDIYARKEGQNEAVAREFRNEVGR